MHRFITPEHFANVIIRYCCIMNNNQITVTLRSFMRQDVFFDNSECAFNPSKLILGPSFVTQSNTSHTHTHTHNFSYILPDYAVAKLSPRLFSLSYLLMTIKLLATDFFFQISAHPVFKMWVVQKPNKVALWNKRHFEEKKNGDYTACLKYSVWIFVE